MTKTPLGIVTGIVLALALPFAIAQDATEETDEPVRRYTVEFIVFAYAEDVGVGTEIFPPEEPEPLMDVVPGFDEGDIPEFTDAAMRPVAGPGQATGSGGPIDQEAAGNPDDGAAVEQGLLDAVLLLDDELTLQGIRDRLSLLDVYQPLLHAGWTQVSLDKEAAEPVELTFFGEPPAGLSGSLTLYLGRYLHLVVELALDEPKDANAEPLGYGEPAFSFGDNRLRFDNDLFQEPGAVVYRISEDRIMRNDDVRYFDHPRFGVIAKVTRVEEPEPDPEDDVPLPLIGGATQ